MLRTLSDVSFLSFSSATRATVIQCCKHCFSASPSETVCCPISSRTRARRRKRCWPVWLTFSTASLLRRSALGQWRRKSSFRGCGRKMVSCRGKGENFFSPLWEFDKVRSGNIYWIYKSDTSIMTSRIIEEIVDFGGYRSFLGVRRRKIRLTSCFPVS